MLKLSNFFYDRLLIPAFSFIYIPLTALVMGVISAYCKTTLIFNYVLVSGLLIIVIFKARLTYKLLLLCFLFLTSFVAGNLLLNIQLLSSKLLERSLLDKTLAIEGIVTESWQTSAKTYKQVLLVKLTQPLCYQSHIIKLYSRNVLCCTPGSKIYCAATRAYLTVNPENNNIKSLLKRTRSTALGTFFALREIICLSNHQNTNTYHKLLTLFTWIKNKRRVLLNTIEAKLSPYAASLYKALFIGNLENHSSQNQQIRITKDFSSCGIMHYLARSGIHVSIILIALYSFLRLIPCPFLLKKLFLLIVLALYALFSWLSLSFLRAFYCCIFRELCAIVAVPFSASHAFGLTSFLLVAYNPSYIFFLDFHLSFGATFMLILMHEVELKHKTLSFSIKSIYTEK